MTTEVDVLHVLQIVFEIDDLIRFGRFFSALGVRTRDIIHAWQGWIVLDVLAHERRVFFIAKVGSYFLGGFGTIFEVLKITVFTMVDQVAIFHRDIQHVFTLIAKLHR